jgi:hypothetical protein
METKIRKQQDNRLYKHLSQQEKRRQVLIRIQMAKDLSFVAA